MNKVIQSLAKDIFINAKHYYNPFVQEDPNFYIRLVAIQGAWVAYVTCTRKVRYMGVDEFINTFTRPRRIRGNVVLPFTNLIKREETSPLKGVNMINPCTRIISTEDRVSEDYLPCKTLCINRDL